MPRLPEAEGFVITPDRGDIPHDQFLLERLTSDSSVIFHKTRHGSLDSLRANWYGETLYPGRFRPTRYSHGVHSPLGLMDWEFTQGISELKQHTAKKDWATVFEYAYLLNSWSSKQLPKGDLDKLVFGVEGEGWHEVNNSLSQAQAGNDVVQYAKTAFWFRLYSPEQSAHLGTDPKIQEQLKNKMDETSQNGNWGDFVQVNLALRAISPQNGGDFKIGEKEIEGIQEELKRLKEAGDLKSYFRLATLVSIADQLGDKTNDPIETQIATQKRAEQYRDNETLKHLEAEYGAQRRLLRDTSLVRDLGHGREGIVGVDGQSYPVPEFDDIVKAFEHNREFFWKSLQRGFRTLLLVPFADSQAHLLDAYKTAILNKYEAGHLKLPEGTYGGNHRWAPDASRFTLGTLYESRRGQKDFYYYPQSLTGNPDSKSKTEVIRESQGKSGEGWNVLLHGVYQLSGDLDTVLGNMTRNFQRDRLIGFTPEDYFLYALAHLDKTDEILDMNESRRSGTSSILLGSQISDRFASWAGKAIINRATPVIYWGEEEPEMIPIYPAGTYPGQRRYPESYVYPPGYRDKNWGRLVLSSTSQKELSDKSVLAEGASIPRVAVKVL